MKKTYEKPEVEIVDLTQEENIAAFNPESMVGEGWETDIID